MNKSQLVDALAARLGDRRMAAIALDGLLETIVDTVRDGRSVTITGFGVFEARARAARAGRNPRTGEAVDVPATTVPAFRPGAGFRAAVGGAGPAPRSTPRPVAAVDAAAVSAAPGEAKARPRKARATASFAEQAPIESAAAEKASGRKAPVKKAPAEKKPKVTKEKATAAKATKPKRAKK